MAEDVANGHVMRDALFCPMREQLMPSTGRPPASFRLARPSAARSQEPAMDRAIASSGWIFAAPGGDQWLAPERAKSLGYHDDAADP